MAVMVWIVVLALQLAFSQQLLYASPPHIPLDFPIPAAIIPVSGRGSALDSATDTSNYALMAWIVQFQVTSSEQIFFGLHTNEAPNIEVSREATGGYSVSVFDYFGRRYGVRVEGVIGKWEHLAVGVCAEREPYRVIVCRTMWKAGHTDCFTRFLDTIPVAYSPDFTRIDIGNSVNGLMHGQFTDVVIYMQGCIGENTIYSQIAPFPCAFECMGACEGPSFNDCLGYSQLFRPDYSHFSPPSVSQFSLSDPSFLHRNIVSPNIGFSGWFLNINPSVLQENLFKLENSRCDVPSNPGDGCQVLGVYYHAPNFVVLVEQVDGLVASAMISDVRTI